MKKFTELSFLFTVVAVIELFYAATGLLTPPGKMLNITGWVLNADGNWLAKLLGMALLFQALVAWILRKKPHLGIARALAVYQIGAATIDWVMMIAMADQDIFSTTLGRSLVIVSVPLHYLIGLLLLIATKKASYK